jgi:hypothetical protein
VLPGAGAAHQAAVEHPAAGDQPPSKKAAHQSAVEHPAAEDQPPSKTGQYQLIQENPYIDQPQRLQDQLNHQVNHMPKTGPSST